MGGQRKTAIVTGASQGIGSGIEKGFVERGVNVVANSRKVTQSTDGAGIVTAASLPMAPLGAESKPANPTAS